MLTRDIYILQKTEVWGLKVSIWYCNHWGVEEDNSVH
jgi:hypothetical protein